MKQVSAITFSQKIGFVSPNCKHLKARHCLSSLSNWQHRRQLSEVIHPTLLTYQPGLGLLTPESLSCTSSGKRPGWLTWPQHRCPERLNLRERNPTRRGSPQPASSGYICSRPALLCSGRQGPVLPQPQLCPLPAGSVGGKWNTGSSCSLLWDEEERRAPKVKVKREKPQEGRQVSGGATRELEGRWWWMGIKNGQQNLFGGAGEEWINCSPRARVEALPRKEVLRAPCGRKAISSHDCSTLSTKAWILLGPDSFLS